MSSAKLLWRRANKATLDTLRGNSPGQYDIRLGRKQEVVGFFEGVPQVEDHDGTRMDLWTEPMPLAGGTSESPPWMLQVRRMSEQSKRRDIYIRAQRPETAHPLWRPGVGPSNRTRSETDYAILLRTSGDRFFAGWLRKAQLRSLPKALRERLESSNGVGATELDDEETGAVLGAIGQETPAEESLGNGSPPPPEDPAQPPPDALEIEKVSAKEGQSRLVQHWKRERSPSLRQKRIALAGADLACEACRFDFVAIYGERGRGFVECHHKVPLAKADPEIPTELEDLALLCANCHRMVHRRPELTVEALKELLIQEATASH